MLFPLRNLLVHPLKLSYLQGSTQTTPCRHKMAYTHCRHPNPSLLHGPLSIITRPLPVERFTLGDVIPKLMVSVGFHLNYSQPNMTEKGTHELSKLNTAITSRGFPAYHDSKETKLLRDALIIEIDFLIAAMYPGGTTKNVFIRLYTPGSFISDHPDHFKCFRVCVAITIPDEEGGTGERAATLYQLRDENKKKVGEVVRYPEEKGTCLIHNISTGGCIPAGCTEARDKLWMYHSTEPTATCRFALLFDVKDADPHKQALALSQDYFNAQRLRMIALHSTIVALPASDRNSSRSPIFVPTWLGYCASCPTDGVKKRATHGAVSIDQLELVPSLEGGPSNEEDRNDPTDCESCAAPKLGYVFLCQTGCGKPLRTQTECKIGHCSADGRGCRLLKTCNKKLENGLQCERPCVGTCLQCQECRAKRCNKKLENGLQCERPCVNNYLQCQECRAKTCNKKLENGLQCERPCVINCLQCQQCRAKTCNKKLENGLQCAKICVGNYSQCTKCRAKRCNKILNGKKCDMPSGNYLMCTHCRSLGCDDENGKKTKIRKV